MHLTVEPDAPRHLARHGLERASVVVEPHTGRPRDEPVGEEGGNAFRDRVLAPLPPAADHVEVVPLELLDEERDVGRVVLQVPVRGDDHVAARAVEARREGRGLAEVAPQDDRAQPGGRAPPARAGSRACRRCSRRRPAPARTSGRSARGRPSAGGAGPRGSGPRCRAGRRWTPRGALLRPCGSEYMRRPAHPVSGRQRSGRPSSRGRGRAPPREGRSRGVWGRRGRAPAGGAGGRGPPPPSRPRAPPRGS